MRSPSKTKPKTYAWGWVASPNTLITLEYLEEKLEEFAPTWMKYTKYYLDIDNTTVRVWFNRPKDRAWWIKNYAPCEGMVIHETVV
ncbi:MAG: hypothetical protein ACXABY_09495 [Candidatus Thorarchaeota archaeon]|jgi:hypothetical protein